MTFGGIASAIMTPLYFAVTAVLLIWHRSLSEILPKQSGWVWALAIVGLTVTVRLLITPLFLQQLKTSHAMQQLQPRLPELQEMYKHDRERLTQEQMKLWKETGTNPFASCLPLLLQMPIFFALERVIDLAARGNTDRARGYLSDDDALALSNAKVFGARIADTFTGSPDVDAKVVAIVLVVIMCAAQFVSQLQMMRWSPMTDDDPYAQQQKTLLYVLPVVFAVGGVAFPIGVLIFWATSNLWSLAQTTLLVNREPPDSGVIAAGG